MNQTEGSNKRLQFNLSEFNGSLGDFGTIIPILMGVALVSDVNISTIFLFFSIWFIIAGLFYRLPIPIEPMKVIGAIVIAEGLAAPEIAASGILLGIIFLFFGRFLNKRNRNVFLARLLLIFFGSNCGYFRF